MPVYLVPHDPMWAHAFAEEREEIVRVLPHREIEVLHIGSTAIPGLAAKPILDVMVLVDDITTAQDCYAPLSTLHYHYVPYAEEETPERRWFCKPNRSERTHHLHLVERNSRFHQDRLSFRDFLAAHPEDARRYDALKRDLAARFPTNREAYTRGKGGFVAEILARARAEELT